MRLPNKILGKSQSSVQFLKSFTELIIGKHEFFLAIRILSNQSYSKLVLQMCLQPNIKKLKIIFQSYIYYHC